MISFKPLSWTVRSDCVSANAFGISGFYVIIGETGDWALRYPSETSMYHDHGYETQHAARAAAQVHFNAHVTASLKSVE